MPYITRRESWLELKSQVEESEEEDEAESGEFAFNWLQGLGLWDIAYPELSVVKIENVLISIFYTSENPIFVFFVFQFFSLNK